MAGNGANWMEEFEAVIGLEVHVQLRTRTKMFCACPSRYGAEPNSLCCPVCLGLPGALPVVNREAVSMAIRFGLAVGASISPESAFYRKQYFYPDLPKGYQITQGPRAVVEGGTLVLPGGRAIGLERAHLEEDAGKCVHDPEGGHTWVDLNRAGVPLLEIVSRPELRSPEEAAEFLRTLHRLVVFLGICDGNMEEGSLRCDANISLRRPGEPFGTRVEIKNINSFRFVKQGLEFEAQRHAELLRREEAVLHETRGWDAARGETRSQRSKEEALDYRYFPEPDLPPLRLREEEVHAVAQAMPELPQARLDRYRRDWGLGEYEADMMLQDPDFARYFEALADGGRLAKPAANWMLGELSRLLNLRACAIGDLGLAPEALREMLDLVEEGTLSHAAAKDSVLPALLAGEGGAREIVALRGLAQVQDRGALEALARQVLEAHPAQVADHRSGRKNLKGFLVGQVMKAAGGKANPRLVNEVLDALLEGGA